MYVCTGIKCWWIEDIFIGLLFPNTSNDETSQFNFYAQKSLNPNDTMLHMIIITKG